ncbi:alpha-ketoglutarate-dependent dioxygenase AlkB family protein [Candidatus Nitrosocosmicus agrestis]|jgi:alkylated DNA repair dioxygenase AlkB|uniref:alpha-ketoglutarate-dependent dioxygenase AlkB family protein n=1 Tax=Candidatus Nitrosocosmicus agrestis TaxID=2563600 RepID=UPI00122E2D1B|nr:alpha-ketoglutarate-dependent dioxygenase AlkB [Candidatus Nitrosocosmicus sp. SS]KAA2280709.1 alpha-ketoglutarate-dependent dioxygenase AlkB [Candidatus Nitrosocosmicus sp. SS]KAF0869307.1 alpha-ketoglutarate-dependent dioxygenase AlkB [Candidatus Nitrosocosmicus sp. SS]
MNLLNDEFVNVLNRDGEANYYGKIMTASEANTYYDLLLKNINWKNDEAFYHGKHIVTKRKVAWYGDQGFLYTYSNTTKQALPWTEELIDLKIKIELITNSTFNSCLLNLYHDGNEGMIWHSDDERSLGKNTVIASVSFGAERKFSFKHKSTKKTISLLLENGSLLLMKGDTQSNWLHSLPLSSKINHPRINLTFRTIMEQSFHDTK